MSTYEPGTVAVVTWDNAPKGRSDVTTERAIYTTDDHWSLMSGWRHSIGKDVPTEVRPLVVLDLDDPAFTVTALRDTLPEMARDHDRGDVEVLRLARQIEAQTKPPRIPEPGLWGVVEAQIGGEGFTFVNRGAGWVCVDDGALWEWSRLIDPTLVRPGIEESS